MVVNEDLTVDVGIVKIHLPNVNYPGFLIMKSLAVELGLKANSDVEEKLRTTLKTVQKDTYKKVIHSEIGFVFINANSKQGDSILKVAIIINQLAIPPYLEELNSDHIEEIKKTLITWKRPKPPKWKEGEILSIPLSDGYGQVLWHQNKKTNVTCAIFGCQGNGNMPNDTVVQSPVISAMTVKDLFRSKGVPFLLRNGSGPFC